MSPILTIGVVFTETPTSQKPSTFLLLFIYPPTVGKFPWFEIFSPDFPDWKKFAKFSLTLGVKGPLKYRMTLFVDKASPNGDQGLFARKMYTSHSLHEWKQHFPTLKETAKFPDQK